MKLGFCARKFYMSIQKIDGSHLEIFEIVIANYSIKDKLKRVRFFQETFLLTNISLKMVLEILFLSFSKADIWFTKREFV